MKKRSIAWLALVLALAMATVGCGGTPEKTAPPATKPPAETVVKIGWYAKVDSMDPQIHTSRFLAMIDSNLHDPLIWEVEPYKFAPGLAEKWEVNKEMTEIVLYLKKDIKLTDGTPFTADILVSNWNRMLDPKTAALRKGVFENIKEFKKVDDYTLKVTFTNVMPRIVNHFTGNWTSPSSPKAQAALGTEYQIQPVGYGPYKFDSRPDENTVILAKNKDYKPPAHLRAPYYDKIIIKVIPEDPSRIVALQNGDVDLIFRPPNIEVAALAKDPKYTLAYFKTPGLPQGYMPNVTTFPTSEKNVRLALIYALDRNEISKLAWFGTAAGASSALASTSWAFWKESKDEYKYNPEKAKQLLEEAGWKVNTATGIRMKNGKPLKIRFVVTAGKDHEVAATRWRAVGFDVVHETMAYEATAKRMADNEYEISRLGLSATDPDVLWGAFHSSQILGGAQFNRTKIADQKLDQLLDQGRQTADFEKRKAIYLELQKYIMGNGWWIPSYEDQYIWAVSSKFSPMEFSPGGNPIFQQFKPATAK
ncbi:MAG: ABC transporter substrate-binding protein [Bacillota bacterium]|nr:ABC transporter substrate-binding protein [Bacillota bacterium]